MSEAEVESDGGLLSRLHVIETQDLSQRAAAYVTLHDELRQQLDAADRS